MYGYAARLNTAKGKAVIAMGVVLVLGAGVAQSLNAAAMSGAEIVYQPVQAISYELGSKRAVGYFSQVASACEVTLMVAEAVDPEVATPTSAARLRLSLEPGQGAALDSEEGQSIDLTCGPRAETLSVRKGDWIAATN